MAAAALIGDILEPEVSVPEASRYARSPEVRPKQAGERLAVYVPGTRSIHVLNPTARLLFTYLEEPADFDELERMLGQATDGDSATIRRDLTEALERFLALGILERVE